MDGSEHKIEKSSEDFIEGWKSHATVYRQAPDKFNLLISKIRDTVEGLGSEYIDIPYTTRIWAAQAK